MPDSAVMTPASPEPISRTATFAQIERSPLNPRKTFDPAAIAELADSIAANGLLQNLVVRAHPTKPKKFELVGGERRHRAIEKLIAEGKADAARPWPIRVADYDDREALAVALTENVARSDLSPLEEAEAFKSLRALKMPAEEIARRIGKTERFVQLRLALLDKLAPKALAALKEGRITLEHARELTKTPHKRQVSILERIVPPGRKVDDPDDAFDYNEIVTAEQLRAELRRDSVPAAEAVFDPALYKGPRSVDPDDGATYFDDIDEFEKLQKAAIEAKAKALAKTHAGGVEFLAYEHEVERLTKGATPYGWARASKTVIADGKAAALFGIAAGKFVVLEGLVKESRAAQSEPVEGVARPKASVAPKPEDIPVGAARQALTIRTIALQTAIATDVAHAKRCVVLALLDSMDIVRLRADSRGQMGHSTRQAQAPEIERTLAAFAKSGLKPARSKLWTQICTLGPAQLDKLFAALVAATVSVESPYANDAWPTVEELAIATTVKPDAAATFKLDADFLAKLKKGQLLRIVADLKLEADPRFAKGSDDLTASVIRKIVLDAGAKLDGYVPIWCRFEPEAAMKAHLKATPKIGAQAAKATLAKIATAPKPPAAKPPAAKPKAKTKAKGK